MNLINRDIGHFYYTAIIMRAFNLFHYKGRRHGSCENGRDHSVPPQGV